MPPGDAHRHAQRRQSCIAPLAELLARREQHPFPQRQDEAGVFGDGDEVTRLDHAALGIVPADQRFRAGEEAGGDRYLRLIDQCQLLVDHGLVQARLHG